MVERVTAGGQKGSAAKTEWTFGFPYLFCACAEATTTSKARKPTILIEQLLESMLQ